MIRLCTCTRGSPSALEYPNHQEGSNSCKSCGGKLSVNRQGSLSGNMLSTVGVELSRVINPDLNWKTASKGRQRAVRRARTSFPGGNKKKSTTKSSKDSEDAADKELKRAGDIPVSESEKLGVSILGRRFSDALESVPIKKRRFLLVRSPSPPPEPSSHSDDSDHMGEMHCASYKRTALYSKQRQERSIADDETGLKDLNEEISDAVDFSGISILAAAACDDSDMKCESMNPKGSVLNGHASKADDLSGNFTCVESHSLSEVTKNQLQNSSEDLHGKSEIHLEASSTLELPGKGSAGMKLDESHDAENSTGTLQNFPDKTGTKHSSHDSRFHWDLNTVMDAWDSNCDVLMNSKPLAPDDVGENGIHNENLENIGTSRGVMECGDAKHAPELVEAKIQVGDIPKVDSRLLDTEVQDIPNVSKDNSVVDHDCCSLPFGDGLVQVEHQLNKASVAMVVSVEETKLLHNQEMGSCTAKISSSLAGGVMGPLGDPLVTVVVQKEKDNVCFGSEVEAETSSSHLVCSVNGSCSCASSPSESHPKVGLLTNKPTLEEDRCPASLAYLDNFSAYHCLTDARTGQPTQLNSSQIEMNGCFHHDSQNGNTDQSQTVSPAEKASDGNICANVINAGDLPGELVRPDGIGETECDHADKAGEGKISPCLSNSLHHQDGQGSSNHDELPSISTTAGEYETTAAELKMDNGKVPVESYVDLGAIITDKSVHIISNATDCNSAGAVPVMVDASPLDCLMTSHEASKCHMDGFVNGPAEAALGDRNCNSDSYASQNDADRAIEMEKVDLEDDDSQYEDGELRESLLNSWGEDGAEEGESEHVDYGSDNGEHDMFESASSFPPTPLQVDHMACKNGGSSNCSYDGAWAGKKDAQNAASQPLLKCLSEVDVQNVRFGNQNVGSIANKVQRSESKKSRRDMRDVPEVGVCHDRVIGDGKFLKEGDDTKELSHLARMKSSGWDQLPECRRSSRDGLRDAEFHSAGQNHVAPSMDASGARESLRRVGSSLRRDLSSQIERPNSADGSHRMDKSYVRASRYDDCNGLDSEAEKVTGAPRSVGRGVSSRCAQGWGRGDRWADSSNLYGHHDKSGCYGPRSFTHPASRNAAAAAVAKVESSGFVVAPDGTIVRAGGVGSARRLPRRSANAPLRRTHRSLSRRGSPIERDRACGMKRGLGHSRESPERHAGIDWGQVGRYGLEVARERYRRPVSDDCMDSSLSMQNSLPRRERSLSPCRGPVHLSRSCTRSRSRSRTHSPHMWTAPRGRSDGTNGGPDSRRNSRSPTNFRTEARMGRMRSPRRRPGFENHMVGHGPTSRNHASPPHSSRSINDRKESPDHLREHDSKQCRVFSRTDRCDLLDFSGRLKPDEYYRSMYSSRFRGCVGFVRGPRHDENGEDRRGHGERYGMLHSVRQLDIDGNIKHLPYDAEGFRAHNPPPKSSEFHRRGSPRGFDRQIESKLEDSPQRVKEEKNHFRYGRSGRPNASFESYGVRARDDDSRRC